jgi:hypothetical protein
VSYSRLPTVSRSMRQSPASGPARSSPCHSSRSQAEISGSAAAARLAGNLRLSRDVPPPPHGSILRGNTRDSCRGSAPAVPRANRRTRPSPRSSLTPGSAHRSTRSSPPLSRRKPRRGKARRQAIATGLGASSSSHASPADRQGSPSTIHSLSARRPTIGRVRAHRGMPFSPRMPIPWRLAILTPRPSLRRESSLALACRLSRHRRVPACTSKASTQRTFWAAPAAARTPS